MPRKLLHMSRAPTRGNRAILPSVLLLAKTSIAGMCTSKLGRAGGPGVGSDGDAAFQSPHSAMRRADERMMTAGNSAARSLGSAISFGYVGRGLDRVERTENCRCI